jgi:hypothetical protein
MKKTALLLAFQLLVVVGWSFAQGSARPTPPPISCFHFSDGESQWSLTTLYMKMGHDSTTSKGPTAFGFTGDYAISVPGNILPVHAGAILSGSYLKMNIPFTMADSANPSDSNKSASANYFGMSLVGVLVPVDGEKKDVAGEIIQIKPTLALFGGGAMDHYGLNMGPLFKSLGSTEDYTVSMTSISFPGGMVAELPLNYTFTLVPFARVRPAIFFMTSKQPSYDFNTMQFTFQDTTIVDGNVSFDYGADIDLRLFRNSPEWVISAGTVLSQVGGLKSGNLQLTVSLKREIGKHYSSTLIGPLLH